ncbi:MAG: response regulator, partial [Bacteroidetes bacterium]|nr:response regulator [Bacteroidota bacterium]
NTGEITVLLKQGANSSGDTMISIRDTGIGIPDEKREMIFEEFRQASEGYNRPYEGSGLGLAITRKSIHLLGCRLNVESEVGIGSTFTLFIPVGMASNDNKEIIAGKTIEPAAAKVLSAESPLLLLVEDNDANIDLVKLFLKKEYRLDVAKEGLSAIELAGRNKYDCILMDINLGPGMDGGEAIELIRQKPEYFSTPIIAVTGYTLQQEKEAILKKGADHYLAKPFNKEQITSLLTYVFGNPVSG